MKSLYRLLLTAGMVLPCLLLSSCEKEPQDRDSGEFTIDNALYGVGPYYAIGFSFEEGRKVRTDESPQPDITVHARTDAGGNITGAYLDTPKLIESFALAGEFQSLSEAEDFFNDLLEVGTYTWTLLADDIKENQVWIFKTSQDNYVKFLITDLLLDGSGDVPIAEITVSWVIQDDGTGIFPG
ncbi:MAG TPA: hypothetical protein VJ877_06820 [Bacteroidales bacterium]|nr:hypothetical protein [Bacteroidales bacterium]